ncbi:unnamed protein product [Trichogramma brassicae]|uniref:Uncharacterized protein n=1 Tax=Trichogramma brassicae TaxID=86971 RepID=A0A6H5JAH2_9HYME|nr:unnamed protein product [Trichogramma brassicae]
MAHNVRAGRIQSKFIRTVTTTTMCTAAEKSGKNVQLPGESFRRTCIRSGSFVHTRAALGLGRGGGGGGRVRRWLTVSRAVARSIMRIIYRKPYYVLELVHGSAWTQWWLPQPRAEPVTSNTAIFSCLLQDSEAAASEVGAEEAYDDGDDSDMYMEPDGAESSHAEHHHHRPALIQPGEAYDAAAAARREPHRMTIVAVHPVQTSIHVTSSESSESSKTSVKGAAAAEPEEKSLESDSQNLFPSFAELFGNHRGIPFGGPAPVAGGDQHHQQQQQQQQQRYRPSSRFLGYFRDRPYSVAASSTSDAEDPAALLGSGNFGVIRGGTYYPEDKEADEYSIDESAYSPFYHGGGGGGARGRGYYKNPKPQPVRGGDIFANFRDFADITAPPKSSFSHLSVVYAAKNGTTTGRGSEQPRNIIETLRMLDAEGELEADAMTTTTATTTTTTASSTPAKKLSKNKSKLLKFKKYQEEKARKTRPTLEPLLALS